MSTPSINCSENEKPMESALNSVSVKWCGVLLSRLKLFLFSRIQAHYFSRRAENHLKCGRYDDAIKYHKETVNCLTNAIAESTIPMNIENLKLQRKYHENIQQIIARQKNEFEDFLLRNGLKIIKKSGNEQPVKENQEHLPNRVDDGDMADNFNNVCDDDNEFFSLVGDLKIDQSDSDNVMHQVINDDIDNEEFFSLQ